MLNAPCLQWRYAFSVKHSAFYAGEIIQNKQLFALFFLLQAV